MDTCALQVLLLLLLLFITQYSNIELILLNFFTLFFSNGLLIYKASWLKHSLQFKTELHMQTSCLWEVFYLIIDSLKKMLNFVNKTECFTNIRPSIQAKAVCL